MSGELNALYERMFENLANRLEPTTHCCECTPGTHHQEHYVHIQYSKCDCDKSKYVLNKN